MLYIYYYIIKLRILYITSPAEGDIPVLHLNMCMYVYTYIYIILLLNEGTRLFAPLLYVYSAYIIHTTTRLYIHIVRTIKVV